MFKRGDWVRINDPGSYIDDLVLRLCDIDEKYGYGFVVYENKYWTVPFNKMILERRCEEVKVKTNYLYSEIVQLNNETLIEAFQFAWNNFGPYYVDTENLGREILDRIASEKIIIK